MARTSSDRGITHMKDIFNPMLLEMNGIESQTKQAPDIYIGGYSPDSGTSSGTTSNEPTTRTAFNGEVIFMNGGVDDSEKNLNHGGSHGQRNMGAMNKASSLLQQVPVEADRGKRPSPKPAESNDVRTPPSTSVRYGARPLRPSDATDSMARMSTTYNGSNVNGATEQPTTGGAGQLSPPVTTGVVSGPPSPSRSSNMPAPAAPSSRDSWADAGDHSVAKSPAPPPPPAVPPPPLEPELSSPPDLAGAPSTGPPPPAPPPPPPSGALPPAPPPPPPPNGLLTAIVPATSQPDTPVAPQRKSRTDKERQPSLADILMGTNENAFKGKLKDIVQRIQSNQQKSEPEPVAPPRTSRTSATGGVPSKLDFANLKKKLENSMSQAGGSDSVEESSPPAIDPASPPLIPPSSSGPPPPPPPPPGLPPPDLPPPDLPSPDLPGTKSHSSPLASLSSSHGSDHARSNISESGSSAVTTASSGYNSDRDFDYHTLSKKEVLNLIPIKKLMTTVFDEEEVAVSFEDDEDEDSSKEIANQPVDDNEGIMFKEFDGDDYSTYLEDDTPAPPPARYEDNTEVRRPKKYQKNAENQVPNGNNTHYSTLPQGPPPSPGSSRSSGIKNKLQNMFTLSRSSKNKAQPMPSRYSMSNIHNFAFADSKMATSLGQAHAQNASGYNYGPGETMSDLGLDKNYWNDDTLASRTLRKKNEGRRSHSVSDILNSDFAGAAPRQPVDKRSQHRGDQGYFSDHDSSGKKSGNKIWEKLSRTLKRRGKKPDSDQGQTSAPMKSHGSYVDDIRL